MATKIDKNELLEPDKLQLFFLSVRAFIEKHRMRIFAGAGIFLLIILLIGFWYLYQMNYERNAGKLYNRVSDATAKAGSPSADTTAIQGYKGLITQYPQSDSAVLASYRLGNLYSGRHEFDAAIGAYNDFLRKAPPRSDLIALAYSGLGGCHEAKRDLNKALECYEKAMKAALDKTMDPLMKLYLKRKISNLD